jgi:hypothetical protein
MSDENASTHEELRLLYQVSVTDLEFFKRQQWSVTNYALLLYAAIIGVARMLDGDVSRLEKLVLCSVATGVAILASYILWVLNNSIDVRKARLASIRKNFSAAFHNAWSAREKEEEALSIYRSLLAIVIIGMTAVWWLVYFKI